MVNPISRLNMALRSRYALALVATCMSCTEPLRGPPNIIFIFSDDHATQAVGAYGSRLAPLDPTPNIDRLAAQGIMFRSAFVTNSICAPSRAVILTGRHSHLNSVPTNRERFDSSQVTFPQLLQGAGYQTAIVGKWHLKSEPTGFDHWEVLPGQGVYYNPDFRTPEGLVRDTGYVTDLITDKALDWLETGRDPTRPFMLMYQHKAPHREWYPGPDHLTTYADVEIPEPPTLFDDYSGRTTATQTQEMSIDVDMRFAYDLKLYPNSVDPDDPLNANVGTDEGPHDGGAADDLGRRVRADQRGFPLGRPHRRGPGSVEVPALHAGLSGFHPLGRR